MRNRGRLLRPDDEERRPTMLYLSDEAREVLHEQRRLDRKIGATPCLDSVFVETAILSMVGKAPPPRLTDPQRMAEAYRVNAINETLKLGQVASRAYELELEVEDLRRKLARAKSGEAIEFDRRFLDLHAAIRKHVLTSMTQLEEAKAIHRVLCEFIVGSPGHSSETQR